MEKNLENVYNYAEQKTQIDEEIWEKWHTYKRKHTHNTKKK